MDSRQVWQTRVHRIEAGAPNDLSGLRQLVRAGAIDPAHVVAVLGKTEGNGCVNDFTRGFASDVLKHFFADELSLSAADIDGRIAMVMSGGTEGALSPHWLVFEKIPGHAKDEKPNRDPRLAIGVSATRELLPEEIGGAAHVAEVRDAVNRATRQAGITSPDEVHYVQVKCPLLTKSRIAEAAARGRAVVTDEIYKSMAYSRGAAALGVAAALGEVDGDADQISAMVCRDYAQFSARASASAGVELMDNQVVVMGNSPDWGGGLKIAHRVMTDAIDFGAVQSVFRDLGFDAARQLDGTDRDRFVAVLAKAESSRSGVVRGARHTMLDDSDIAATRHARAVVGGVIAAMAGDTRIFVSGGAEHQGPDGGGPIALIATMPESL